MIFVHYEVIPLHIYNVDQMTFLEENLCGTASAITKNIFLTKD